MTRVCVVAPSMRFVGGQAIQAQRLMGFLGEAPGIEVGFIPHDPVLPGVLGKLQRVKYVRTVVTTAAYLWLLISRVPRYDVIHAFSASYWSYFLSPMLAILVARAYGRRVILNYRSGELEDHLSTWPRFVTRTMALADRIVTPTPYLTEVYARFGMSADVIPNYLDPERFVFRVRDPVRPVFLVNRNFHALYNHATAIEVFRRVQAEHPEARLILAGYGPLEGEIRAAVARLGLRHVEFRGKVTAEQMVRLYDEADVYLNTPDIDCFPGSVLEAFAAGTPVVTTDAGGIRFLVRHDDTGMTAGCGDAATLAGHALRLLAEPGLGRRLATAARRELESRYVWGVVGDQWLALYRTLAAGDERASTPG